MSRFGLGLLALALVLGACWLTPGSAWAQDVGEAADETVETVEAALEEAEESADEIPAELQAEFDEAKAAAAEAGDYDVKIEGRHRAWGDARATAWIAVSCAGFWLRA